MHGQLSHSGVDHADAEFTRSRRPDGRATGQIGAGHETLDRHLGLPTRKFERSLRGGISCVALVCVDLDHRAAVERNAVIGFVPIDIVGVGCVRPSALMTSDADDAAIVASRSASRLAQMRSIWRRRNGDGSGCAHAADLFVVEERQHRNGIARTVGNLKERACGDETRQLIVEPGGHEERVVETGEPGRGEVMRHHFPGDDLIGRNGKLIGEVLAKGRRLAEPPHRNHVSLTVEVESTRSELAVEVNR